MNPDAKSTHVIVSEKNKQMYDDREDRLSDSIRQRELSLKSNTLTLKGGVGREPLIDFPSGSCDGYEPLINTSRLLLELQSFP